jgi:hypothetical protein
MVASVRQRVSRPDRVIDMLVLDLLSSIAVLRRATCCVAPAGTAHHKVDRFHDIPRMLHVSAKLATIPRDQWAGLRQPMSTHAPAVVVGHDEGPDSVRRRRSTDARPGLSDFTLSWEPALDALAPLLESGTSRPTHRGTSGANR